MEQKKGNSMLALLLLLLVGGGLFVYKNFFSVEVIVETATIEREAENTRRLLDQINSIDLDREFLASPLVQTLANFYVTPEQAEPGKDNPFASPSGGLSNEPLPLEDLESAGTESADSQVIDNANITRDNEL